MTLALSLVNVLLNNITLLGGVASCSASDAAYSCTVFHSVVCLSVVCHIRAPCLNSSLDLDAIWQVHLQHVVLDEVPGPRGRGDFGGQTPIQNTQLRPTYEKKMIYDSPSGTIDSRIRLLPNYFGPCYDFCYDFCCFRCVSHCMSPLPSA